MLFRSAASLGGTVTYTHIRREANKVADALCNEALDGKPRPRPSPGQAESVLQIMPAEAFAAASEYPSGFMRTLEAALEEIKSGSAMSAENLARRLAPYLRPGP